MWSNKHKSDLIWFSKHNFPEIELFCESDIVTRGWKEISLMKSSFFIWNLVAPWLQELEIFLCTFVFRVSANKSYFLSVIVIFSPKLLISLPIKCWDGGWQRVIKRWMLRTNLINDSFCRHTEPARKEKNWWCKAGIREVIKEPRHLFQKTVI